MNSYGYIYKTTNLLNGKIYIGLHRGEFDPSYFGSGKIMIRAIRQNGKSSFKVEPIDYAESEDDLNKLEIIHIDIARRTMPKGMVYNISNGGSAPMNGRRHSDELKARWSKERSGKNNTMYGVRLIGKDNPMWGRKHSQETKNKISEKATGRRSPSIGIKRSDSSREKMRVAWIERKKNFLPSMLYREHSKETKRKLSISKKEYYKTHDNPFKGKRHSEETKIKMRARKDKVCA